MRELDTKEYHNVYAIPANYTDSGKLLGGMVEVRNAAETVFLVLALGYPELALIPMPGTVRIVVMTVTLLPAAVLSMMGIDGDSLFQYAGHVVRHVKNRKRLHYRRVGYQYGPKQIRDRKGGGKKDGSGRKAEKKEKKNMGERAGGKVRIRPGLHPGEGHHARDHRDHGRKVC